MKQISTLTLLMVSGLGGALVAGGANAAPGYTEDSGGQVVTSNFGECVQTGTWKQDMSIPECDAALAARLEAEKLAAAEAEARRAAELAALERPTPAPKPTLVRLSDQRNVMFEFNSATLTPAAAEALDGALAKIREFDQLDRVEIVGHTDSSGPETYNRTLSQRRADSVRQFLESRGVDASILSARGEGEANPLADNATRQGRAQNRRVDILISGEVAK